VVLHRDTVAVVTVHECSFKLLSQPPYSPDMTIGFPAVQPFKGITLWRAFEDEEAIIMTVNE